MAGIRHRSLFVLEDLYIHLIETDGDPAAAVDKVRDHALFREISHERLEPYCSPYDPETWRSPGRHRPRILPLDSGSLSEAQGQGLGRHLAIHSGRVITELL